MVSINFSSIRSFGDFIFNSSKSSISRVLSHPVFQVAAAVSAICIAIFFMIRAIIKQNREFDRQVKELRKEQQEFLSKVENDRRLREQQERELQPIVNRARNGTERLFQNLASEGGIQSPSESSDA